MGQAESYEGNVNCPVNRYRYSPLPQGCIRLLRLLPSEKSDSRLQGHLFNYPLGLLAAKTHLYEALSYVWGDLNNNRLISLENRDFPVTENLHTALLYLRDQYIERIIWVDAVCINQEDLNERGEQVRRMAEIYSKASRVIVWLGHMEDHSNDALETIRIAAQRPHSMDDKLTREAVLSLLRRPWFERIWVLQEVASARQILIKCGDTEMDGYVFCTGLTSKSFDYLYKDFPDLHAVVRPVIFLMSESLFRPKVVERTSNEFSLNIHPLGELLDMYHTRKATKQHDKLFALTGMSSDTPTLTDLLPDYSTPWAQLFEQLIRYLFGGDVTIRICDASERALISGSGYILGKVLSVRSNLHEDGQDVGLATRDIDGSFGPETQWHVPDIAKPVQVGDLVCQLRGAAKPTIIRLCHDHFSIIMIAPPLELKQPMANTSLVFFLSWDWQDPDRKLSNLDDVQRSLDNILPWHWGHQCAACSSELYELWCTGLILDEAEEYRLAENKLQQVLSGYEETIGVEDPRTLACMDKLALVHKKMGLLNDEEPNMVPEELRGLRLSELSSLNDWTFRLKFKQKGVIRYGTAFRINIPGVKRAALLTARRNLTDEQGRLSQDIEIYNEHGRNKLRDIAHKEVFLSTLDPRCASDRGMYSGYGALLFDMEAESYLGGYGFSLEFGQANLEGDGLGVCGYLKQGTLSRSTGLCLSCQDNRMTYNAITMPGMSGSPVFLSRNGDATAVGIHIDSCDVGGWCMRLTVEVLEEIFGWAKGMYTNTCLKISPTVRLPQEGVYLHFPDHEHAVAAIGEQVPPTIFNILPLYAPSGTGCSEFYVFRFRVPPKWPRPNKKWVQWDITNNTVRLTSYLRKSCIVKLHSILEGGPNTFRVFIEDSELAIRVQQNRRVYSTRVLFVTRGMPRMSWPYFNHFTLEARSPN